MCGLAGFIALKKIENPEQVLKTMLKSINWRGPDASGTWNDGEIFLGHNRLSILDLSDSGSQPMHSSSGRFVIVYNGEVYNFQELKAAIGSDVSLRGSSDTEIILEVIEKFGVFETAKKLAGIFAFAVYDKKLEKLFLVRDQIGVKPLYYANTSNGFLFGSQIKTFCDFPEFERKISQTSMQLFFKYNTVPSPFAIYEGCFKVPPATVMEFDKQGKLISEQEYWSMQQSVLYGAENPFATEQEAIETVENFIKESVRRQLVADVPVGAFLSGGIDSSMVSCFASATKSDLKTFSIGFAEKKYDESVYARTIAKYLGTEHIEKTLSASDALSIIPKIPDFCDEPLNDASQIPTYFVSQLAREHVTVVVSGDGGDELFGGYSRYTQLLKLRGIQQKMPNFCMPLIKGFNMLPAGLRGLVGQKLALKLSLAEEYLKHDDIRQQYDALFNFWPEIYKNGDMSCVLPEKVFPDQSVLSYMSYHDAKIYLPDVILNKVDRSSMYTSIESRVPLLDHGLYELSCKVPDCWKLEGNITKSILKKILYKHIPRHLVDRPKMGFGVPIDMWIRHELKDWAMSLMDDMKNDGVLPFDVIERKMSQHQKLQINWQYALWAALVWQQWKNHYNASY